MAEHELIEAARAIAPSIVADRRAIHQHPELAYQETQTAAFVDARLRELGIETRTGVGGTGVVGLIRGGGAGKTVLLRADMDALPITEVSDAPYVSQNRGVMHACGHDGHTAMLLAVARLLTERKARINGTVKLMFQPAEEGGAGALKMIEDGLLEAPTVDAAFALHVEALRRVGEIGLRTGPAWAASDRFTILVKGRGGHAARPNLAVDPIVVAAQIVTALQTLVSREIAPYEPALVTVGRIEAGTTFNVIADTATIQGTVRSYTEDVRAHLEQRLGELAAGIARAMRGDAETTYMRGYPPLVNHPEGIETVRAAATELLGAGAPVEMEALMGSEDFSFVLEKVPGCMFRLGVRAAGWETPRPTHSAIFDMDESALPIGTAVMTATALRYLRGA